VKLNLKNPLVFFDLETTGTNIVSDRIIEISCLKIYPNGNEESKTCRINPEIPIHPQSTAIHGITDEDVKDAPVFRLIAKSLATRIEGCDLAGYNSNRFDIPLLAEEFLRADMDVDLMKRKFIDVQNIFHKKEQRTLEAAYKFYCNKAMENAHTAEADAKATYEILQSQLDRYPDLTNDINFLSEYSAYGNNVDFAGRVVYDEQKKEIINFGKYRGRPVEDVLREDPGYYGWVLQGDFPLYTKKIFTAIKLRSSCALLSNNMNNRDDKAKSL
jgi:DNA polymerase-3 subunit epsilon